MDPLLPDSRVARIEQALRLRYPALPFEVAFVTYHQPREVTVTQDGLEIPVEAQAVMLMSLPNPRHRCHTQRWWLTHRRAPWR